MGEQDAEGRAQQTEAEEHGPVPGPEPALALERARTPAAIAAAVASAERRRLTLPLRNVLFVLGGRGGNPDPLIHSSAAQCPWLHIVATVVGVLDFFQILLLSLWDMGQSRLTCTLLQKPQM
jgi:hypothetical protein